MTDINTTAWFDALDISDGGIFPYHRQQVSRTVGGKSLSRNFGTQLWRANFITTPMLLQDAMDLETDILALDGALGWIAIFDPRRRRPREYASGALTGYAYASITTNRHIINLTVGATALSKGDYFSFTHDGSQYLHRITNMVTATQAQVWPAMSLNAPDTSGIVVDKAFARFQMEDSTVNSKVLLLNAATKTAQVTLKGVQTIV